MTEKKLPLKKRIRYMLETIIVYTLYYFFYLLPLNLASNTGGFVMRNIGPFIPSTKIARKNLLRVFPEKTDKEREKIIKGMWDNLGRVAAEYPHLKHIWKNVEVVGKEYFDEARKNKESSIFYAAHLANWEITPLAAYKAGIEIFPVYRIPSNRGIEKLLKRARSFCSTDLIPKGHKGAKKMLSVLRSGGSLGLLMDQKLNEGIAVPFFGHDAMTATAIAVFTLKTKCKLYPARSERIKGTKFKVTIYPPLNIKPSGNNKKDIENILKRINKDIENWIRERPEQWLWIHNRWPKDDNFFN